MEHLLKQQGTQASKLVPDMYRELKEQHGGSAALDYYTVNLSEPDTIHIQTCSLPKSDNIAINLEIGDSEEIKRYNLQELANVGSHFFTSIDYGYGVGTFQANKGGFAHVTTAYGNEVFFSISADGTVRKDSTYVKPNEPYSVILEASEIGVTLDDVTASQVYEAGEIIVRGSTGPITYTRAADSTESVIYFTDTRKDGKLAILSYTAASKSIQASIT